MKRIRVTYATVTEESAANGDYSESGWLNEEGIEVEDAFEALETLRLKWATDPSSSVFMGGVCYSTQPDIDYSTGEETTESYHLHGFTDAEQASIYAHIIGKGGYFAIVRTDWVGPAFAVGLSKDHAWEVFRNTREDLGIDPKLTEAEHFECVSITKQDADAILAGDTEAWEANV